MLTALTASALPPPVLVAAARQLFERTRDARALVPVLPGLDKSAVARLLPALVGLPPEAFRAAAAKLVTPQPPAPAAPAGAAGAPPPAPPRQQPPLFAPSELLVALHTLEGGGDPGLLRKQMAAVGACLNDRCVSSPQCSIVWCWASLVSWAMCMPCWRAPAWLGSPQRRHLGARQGAFCVVLRTAPLKGAPVPPCQPAQSSLPPPLLPSPPLPAGSSLGARRWPRR